MRSKKMKMQVDSNVTIKEAFEEFMLSRKVKNLAQATLEYYENVYRVFIRFFKEQGKVQDINSRRVQEWVMYLKSANIEDISVNTYIRAMRTFLYFCMTLGYIETFKIGLIKMEKKVKKVYSDEELTLMLKKPDLKKCDFVEYRN